MKKFFISLLYLLGLLCNGVLALIGIRILQSGYFSGRSGHIAADSEAAFLGIMFVALGLGSAIYLVIAYAKHLLYHLRSLF
jgi:hypothetical protein